VSISVEYDHASDDAVDAFVVSFADCSMPQYTPPPMASDDAADAFVVSFADCSMPQPDGSSASGMVILPRLRYAQVGAWTVVAGYILDHAFAICFSSENTSSEKAKLPGVAAGKAVFTWRKATSKTGRIKCVQVIPMCCPGVRDQS
jgi:hypothetical protein